MTASENLIGEAKCLFPFLCCIEKEKKYMHSSNSYNNFKFQCNYFIITKDVLVNLSQFKAITFNDHLNDFSMTCSKIR